MARRAELFVRDLTDEEAAHLLKQARRGKNAVVRHRAMLLFASFQGQSVSQIAAMFGRAQPTSAHSSTTSTSGGSGPGPSVGRGPTAPDRSRPTDRDREGGPRPPDRSG